MNTTQSDSQTPTEVGEDTPRKLLRVWPAIVIVVLQWLFRFGVKELFPGIQGFGYAVMGSLALTLLLIAWWTFFSRARWRERFIALGVIAVTIAATWLLKHDSMWLPWLLAYAIPVLCLAFVIWAVATRRLPDRIRHATMAATIVVACGGWLLLRQNGINGDHNASFGWRWSPSSEERLLAESANEPTTPAPAPAPTQAPSATPTASATPEKQTTPEKATETRAAEWPGFRGPRRDSIVRGVKIKTDWSASPPVQMWRRPVGPAWSSFAVNGDLVYTQEQRGDNEEVTCYRATTGQPVWTHSDKARFFESNAGAGPRGTPTLSNGRVYTFGATGILNALDARNGSVIWSHNAGEETNTKVPFWGFSSSPLIAGDLVIVAAAGQLVAYEAATGNRRWVGPTAGGSYSSPQLVTLNGVTQILMTSEGRVTSVSPTDGKQLWQHQWPANTIVQPAVTPDGNILITSQEQGARRLAVAHNASGWTVEERWTSNGLKPYFNDFVIHKGFAYGFDGRILSCIDLNDGQRKWKGGRYGNGQLVLLPDQDLLLVLSEEGELALVAATADQFTEIAKFTAIQGKTWNHPVLVGDMLLVRNADEMAAFRLR
ncbi:MAG TPA: PQQ-binding-like beta-propeller repeat protein [Pyrinomonadaceae bacterium]|nr:PQQ-binding-like beta-propeller repeat protein [Pyrinomonadaceae bacterium]